MNQKDRALGSASTLQTGHYRDDGRLRKRIAIHELFSTNEQVWYHWLFNHVAWPNGSSVLELGSGTGAFWADNRTRLPAGIALTLTDHSAGMVAVAQATLADAGIPARFLVADAQSLPFADRHFDIVIANHMLYHVSDLPCALGEIRRVLKPTGSLYAATNGLRHMAELWALTDEPDHGREIGARFSLEDGAALLAAQFSHVTRTDYSCDLRITAVPPVLEYIASAFDNPDPAMLALAERTVAAAIARDGAFHVGKSVGLFRASTIP